MKKKILIIAVLVLSIFLIAASDRETFRNGIVTNLITELHARNGISFDDKKLTNILSIEEDLSVFNATSSAQMLALLSDETGTGALVFGTTPTITGLTQAAIDDKIWRIAIPISSVFVDSVGPITSASAPALETVDNTGAIVWDVSTEVAEIHFPWMPDLNYTDLSVKMIATSDDASGANQAVDWGFFVHGNNIPIPSMIAQTGMTLSSATLDGTEELITLTLDATGKALITAGTTAVTIAVWNDGTSDGTLEIKKIWLEETR